MNIVNFWKQQTEQWKTENKCGFCWEFDAPLTDEALNKSQNEERCCTYVYLTDVEESYTPKYSEITQLKNGENEDNVFTLYVVKRGKLDTNNYQEMKDHPISESNWETIYEPLRACLTQDNVLNFCSLLGLQVKITQWRMTTVNKEFDNNYIGWKIRANFRIER